ncbi:MAG: alternative ribosome rescue aminoacyl-tRNA hydrolase ArfB [Acidobacteria bacterium]|nr:alternative ribosome rescue aminoacyl-tRNA hydrolase ArfB [Acidobacteriota bacterium]
MDDLPINDQLTIPAAELSISFARSGGPGGQNVNKVATKVDIRWTPADSAVLTEIERRRLLRKLANRLTTEGELLVISTRTRDQSRNREDAREKLAEIIREAIKPPIIRKKTRAPKHVAENRLAEKKQRSVRKTDRRSPGERD